MRTRLGVTQSRGSFTMSVNNTWSESRLLTASHVTVSQLTVCALLLMVSGGLVMFLRLSYVNV